MRHVPYMLKPLLARCLRRSQTLSLSVTSRGLFLAKEQKGELWRWKEKYACLILLLFTFFAGTGKLLYGLSQKGIYIGAFRFIYDLAKLYL